MSQKGNRAPQGSPAQQRHGIPPADIGSIAEESDTWPDRLAAMLAERSRRREVLAETRREMAERRHYGKAAYQRRKLWRPDPRMGLAMSRHLQHVYGDDHELCCGQREAS